MFIIIMQIKECREYIWKAGTNSKGIVYKYPTREKAEESLSLWPLYHESTERIKVVKEQDFNFSQQ